MTREQVRELLAKGMTRAQIAERLGISKATVSYHARRLGAEIDDRFARRYDWQAIQRFYDEGHSPQECCERFGCSKASWQQARARGELRVRPTATPLEEWLIAGRRRTRFHLKNRLLAEGLKQNHCELCGVAEWQGQPITLALHHVNGDGHDNRLENLQLLCPNCHSQTENFAGRNRGRLRLVR